MTWLLAFLLLLTLTGLGFLGYHFVKLRIHTAGLTVALASQREQHDKDLKKLSDYSASVKAWELGVKKKYAEDAKKWATDSMALKSEIQRLSKWKNIADADARAGQLIQTAQATLAKAKADADSVLAMSQQRAASLQAQVNEKTAAEIATAGETAKRITAEAKDKAKALKDEAQTLLNSAATQAAKVVEAANKKAEEIGGSAYEALKNASLYERTAKAIKNIIEGYGDQYIVPEQSLLDELADDFSHAQAGQELKRVREYSKVMIRNGTAAACDYVETARRETAVNFVLDAFNGKVDSILSRTKHDNAGTLEQQVRDAFTLVNYNGKAFREARIKDEYLAARLDELKWATVAHQFSASGTRRTTPGQRASS